MKEKRRVADLRLPTAGTFAAPGDDDKHEIFDNWQIREQDVGVNMGSMDMNDYGERASLPRAPG